MQAQLLTDGGRPPVGNGAVLRPGIAAVLLDRDGTLVVDVPYNGDPDKVRPMPGARSALRRLRAAGLRTAVISNQSGVGRGMLTIEQVLAVNARIDQLLGPFDGWFFCPHTAEHGCRCRKPAPGLVLQAAGFLGVKAAECVVIGDIGADLDCASAAGAQAVLVPTPQTRSDEIRAAALKVPTITAAADLVLGAIRASRG